MHWLIVNGELVLYGFVGAPDWDVDGFTSIDVLEALMLMSGPLAVRINSAGGVVTEGVAIYNAIRMHAERNGVEVSVFIDGAAYSTASLIAMAGDRIVMNAGTTMMVHDPSTITFGNAAEQRQSADVLDKMANQFAAIYGARAGITPAAARDLMRAETWFTPEEAVAAGFADEVGPTATMAAPLFDYRLFRHSPTPLMQLATASASKFAPKAAHAAQPSKETGMTLEQLSAMLAARYGKPAEAVTMFLNQAIMVGIEIATLVGLVKDTTSMEAGQAAVRAKAGELLTGSTSLTPPPAVTPPGTATMSAADLRDVMTRAQSGGLDMAATNVIMALPSKEAAFAAIIDKVAEMHGGGRAPTATSHVVEDARDKFVAGATKGLMHKVGLRDGERNEFTGLTMVELARETLMIHGRTHQDVRRMDKMLMVGTAFTMASGMHSTSDFGYILQNVAQKSALKGYVEAEETFQLWTSKGQASDFKPISRVDLGLFPALDLVSEGAEYKYATIGDRGVTVVVATYGKMIAITRQAIINDDMSILGTLPVKMGRAAKRTIGNLVYGFLNTPGNWSDSVAFFHANHGNLAGSLAAPSETTLTAARTAMGKQQDGDKNAIALNIRPKYALSSSYETTFDQLFKSTASLADSKNAGVANPVQGFAIPITDQRITASTWYLAADPGQYDTIEVTYLDGIEEPVVESQNGWSVDGTELKVRIDAGVNPLDFRGLYKGQ